MKDRHRFAFFKKKIKIRKQFSISCQIILRHIQIMYQIENNIYRNKILTDFCLRIFRSSRRWTGLFFNVSFGFSSAVFWRFFLIAFIVRRRRAGIVSQSVINGRKILSIWSLVSFCKNIKKYINWKIKFVKSVLRIQLKFHENDI